MLKADRWLELRSRLSSLIEHLQSYNKSKISLVGLLFITVPHPLSIRLEHVLHTASYRILKFQICGFAIFGQLKEPASLGNLGAPARQNFYLSNFIYYVIKM